MSAIYLAILPSDQYILAMQEEQSKKILKAFQLVLRPVVKILLRYGIGYNSFAETVKTAFVDVASSDFGIRGRPTNISRVAVMTGLTRKEVRRIRTKLDKGEDDLVVKTTPITEVLTHWHSESDFLDDQGRPATLSFAGEKGSFTDLVKRFAGDVPPGAMRTEMKRMGIVDESDGGFLAVLSRTLTPPDSTQQLLTNLVHSAYPMLSSIAINTDPSKIKGEGNPQFATYSTSIEDEDRPRVRRICRDRLSEAAVSFDDLLTAYESPDSGEGAERENPVVMVGLFYFEETDSRAHYKW